MVKSALGKHFHLNTKKVNRGTARVTKKKALSQAVWSNSEASWIELLMLAKYNLCRPAPGGKSHVSQILAWTHDRLQRWLAGERAELWNDPPQYKSPCPRLHIVAHTRCSLGSWLALPIHKSTRRSHDVCGVWVSPHVTTL